MSWDVYGMKLLYFGVKEMASLMNTHNTYINTSVISAWEFLCVIHWFSLAEILKCETSSMVSEYIC